MSFWDIFYKLCAENDKKPNNVAKELGIASGTITQWKNGSIPSKEKLILLSEYFGVTTDYLLGNSPVRHGGMEIQMIDDESYVPIPVIGEVAAGYKALAETNIIGYELVSLKRKLN